jgi:streptomycin 6-kinase
MGIARGGATAAILLSVADQAGPVLDDEVRRRLGRRYGPPVDAWCDALPQRLQDIAVRWRLDLGPLVRRGTVSVVLRCRDWTGAPAILKVSPNHERIATEGHALAAWRTPRVPRVLASDPDQGALLLEAIRPGVALDESDELPSAASLASLMDALHRSGPPPESVPSVEDRVVSLFDAGEANYVRRPDLADVVPRSLYDHGGRVAITLATESGPRRVVVHGDLTPVNVLDGGRERGLVAVDPAPCFGDPAFDTVDLLLWKARELDDLAVRAEELAAGLGLSHARLLRWCAAFAAMTALEEAEAAPVREPLSSRLQMLLDLSREA